jgi:lipoprotein NlpI
MILTSRVLSLPGLRPRIVCQLGRVLASLLLGGACLLPAAEVKVDDLLNEAQTAALKGDATNALALVNQAIQAAPTNAQCYYVRGRIYSGRGERTNALADFDRVLQMEPRAGQVYEYRAFEYFRLGQFTNAIADFDGFLQFRPNQAAFSWQRGVACYFAGRFDEARKQFELHGIVNSNDLQNVAWHFACVARQEGVEKARAALMPKVNDRRVPMKQIYALLQGKLKPDDVLAVARAGAPSASELKARLFHAHFYIGLYYEALGQEGLARAHVLAAADDYAPPTYMGDVARVHAALLRAKPASAK